MSAVLTAMDIEPRVGLGAVRFSLGRYTTPDEVDAAGRMLVQSLA
jgi:cysteine sulfinate desulfinase/cysteine desulfurase-like protein